MPRKHGTIAFITTPDFRESSPDLTEAFICRHLYTLCNAFTVMTTGRTFEMIKEVIAAKPRGSALKMIEEDMKLRRATDGDIGRWRSTILRGLRPTMARYPGMIHVAY